MRRLVLVLPLLALAACASDPPPPPPAPAPQAQPVVEATEPAQPHTAAAAEPATASTESTEPKASEGISFTAPEGWVAEKPANRMRKAQFRLPGADGHEDASLVVFFFGGGGGGIEANVNRWIGQFSQPDGSSTAERTVQESKEVNGLPVHLVDIPGSYVAETTPGSGQRVNKADWRMLGAIVEGDGGAYFLKLVGPSPTIEKWRDSFGAYVDSATP